MRPVGPQLNSRLDSGTCAWSIPKFAIRRAQALESSEPDAITSQVMRQGTRTAFWDHLLVGKSSPMNRSGALLTASLLQGALPIVPPASVLGTTKSETRPLFQAAGTPALPDLKEVLY